MKRSSIALIALVVLAVVLGWTGGWLLSIREVVVSLSPEVDGGGAATIVDVQAAGLALVVLSLAIVAAILLCEAYVRPATTDTRRTAVTPE